MNRPNILLISVDQWSARYLGCANHPCVMTPTLDSLASNGIRFTNAYSATPTCIPARRALMTGTTAQTHGDRIYKPFLEMPNLPTMAQVFAEANYQTYAVGKLHVYPQRDRIGFHDVMLNEEGRHYLEGNVDDYEFFLAEQGYPGQELTHGMCNNDYMVRPWHLPEHCHPTNWTVKQMCKVIKRRDPRKPAFWCMSFNAPHPPVVPLDCYMNLYKNSQIPEPFMGGWAKSSEKLPWPLKRQRDQYLGQGHEFLQNPAGLKLARQAYYAMCTHVDHQIRLVIGMLGEEKLLNNTIIAFTADHGEMLGNHGMFGKCLMLEDSAKVPLIIVPADNSKNFGNQKIDDRLIELRDVMPTLLDMAGIDIPNSVEGISLFSGRSREYLYGEHFEDKRSNRMIRDSRFKLIYYPVGNHIHLFDLKEDPDELCDLSISSKHDKIKQRLIDELIKKMYGSDIDWIEKNKLVGLPETEYVSQPDRGLYGQRGWRFM